MDVPVTVGGEHFIRPPGRRRRRRRRRRMSAARICVERGERLVDVGRHRRRRRRQHRRRIPAGVEIIDAGFLFGGHQTLLGFHGRRRRRRSA